MPAAAGSRAAYPSISLNLNRNSTPLPTQLSPHGMLQCGQLSGRNMKDESEGENQLIQKKAIKKPASFISRDFGRKKVFHLDDEISPFTHNYSSNIDI